MDFRSVEGVLRFLESSVWRGEVQQENVLETALAPTLIDDVFARISSGTEYPVIVESGCGAGLSTAEILEQLEERNLTEYQLHANDVSESVVRSARSRFSGDQRVKVELRSGFDFSGFEDESVDGILSFNCMLPLLNDYSSSGNNDALEYFLRETSRVLKEGKPLVLTHLDLPFLVVKNSSKRKIPLEIKLFEDREEMAPLLGLMDIIGPIENEAHLTGLVEKGFEVRGPRGESSKDIVSFQRILQTGRVFVPEPWLTSQGYQAVEPSPFTRGKRILWKEKDNFPDEYASSNYSLVEGDQEMPLYLKVELPNLGD